MGEIGETWAAIREERAAKRARNREHSAEMLVAAGFGYENLNADAHLRVEKSVDFWPGTGLWKDLQTKRHGRGVRQLIKYLEGKQP